MGMEGDPKGDRLGFVLFAGALVFTAVIVLAAYVYTWLS
jgi:hypothetical protein